jgi:ribosomal protein S18 acetylase RimI-like enzyme
MIEGNGVSPAQGTVRVATKDDVPAVAALHCTAIREGFLSTLGDRFLSRLYTRIVASPHGFLLVADGRPPAQGAGLAGFVAGSADIGRLYREFLWRDGLSVALSSGARLMRSFPRVVETLRHATAEVPARFEPPLSHEMQRPETELLALAVDGAARRQGIGASLVQAFLAAARAEGSATARVVVAAENRSAIELYGRAGFCESNRMELHRGTESLLMRVGLSGAAP